MIYANVCNSHMCMKKYSPVIRRTDSRVRLLGFMTIFLKPITYFLNTCFSPIKWE